jgi:dynein intermediate chain 1
MVHWTLNKKIQIEMCVTAGGPSAPGVAAEVAVTEEAPAAAAAEGEEGAEKAEGGEAEPDTSGTPMPAEGAAAGGKKLTNQFNFSERASQTYNNPYRVSVASHKYFFMCAMHRSAERCYKILSLLHSCEPCD